MSTKGGLCGLSALAAADHAFELAETIRDYVKAYHTPQPAITTRYTMAFFGMFYNPFIAAIVGGTVAPIIGGLILAGTGMFDSARGPGAVVITGRLLLYAGICAGLGGLLFGVFKPGLFSFSITEMGMAVPGCDAFVHIYLFMVGAADIAIRTAIYALCTGGIYLAMFFNIGIHDLMER